MKILLSLLLIITLSPLFGQDLLSVISSNTWFEKNEWTTLVFVKTDSNQLKAFRQINGSGVPVIATEIFNVTIVQDSIFLLKPQKEQQNASESLMYTYSNSQGLLRNGVPLRLMHNEPIVYLSTANNQLSLTRVNTYTITKYDFDNNLVYVNEKAFIIKTNHR